MLLQLSPRAMRNCVEGDQGGWIKVRHDPGFKWKKVWALVEDDEFRYWAAKSSYKKSMPAMAAMRLDTLHKFLITVENEQPTFELQTVGDAWYLCAMKKSELGFWSELLVPYVRALPAAGVKSNTPLLSRRVVSTYESSIMEPPSEEAPLPPGSRDRTFSELVDDVDDEEIHEELRRSFNCTEDTDALEDDVAGLAELSSAVLSTLTSMESASGYQV